jgi:hypothetical protein
MASALGSRMFGTSLTHILMRPTRIASLTALLLACSSGPSIHGEWTGKDRDDGDWTLLFKPDGKLTSIVKDAPYDFTYSFDASKDPMWLDLISAVTPDTIRGIVQFDTEDLMRLRINTETLGNRPNSFLYPEAGGVYVFRRAR